MDTELQNAADQAALAAASQLDGETGACARAAAAASNMITNHTIMANEGGANSVIVVQEEAACDGIGSIRFFRDIEKTQPASTDAEAKYVEVIVDPREAFFALTPVVGALSSGQISARAFATLGAAYCKTPPVMICNPEESAMNGDFDADDYEGVGLKLVSVGAAGGWAPGNFGYLDTGGGSNGAPGLREGLGWGTPPGNCLEANGLDTKPGATVTVTDSINTRFDVYPSNVSCPAGGTCPASINSMKDVRRPANANGGNACRLHNQGWQLPANYYGQGTIPSSATVPLDASVTPGAMGHPRDMCHAVDSAVAGACATAIGDGVWDRDAYFRTNYRRADGTYWTGGTAAGSWQANTGLPANAKRYDVYIWEIQNRGDLVDGVTVLGATPAGATGATNVAYGTPVCSPTEGYGAGVDPTNPAELTPDRRKIIVAVVNCLEESVNGNSVGVQVKDWIEVFLVEPSVNRARTSAGDFYVEVIGGADVVNTVQQVEKKVPYLIQ